MERKNLVLKVELYPAAGGLFVRFMDGAAYVLSLDAMADMGLVDLPVIDACVALSGDHIIALEPDKRFRIVHGTELRDFADNAPEEVRLQLDAPQEDYEASFDF